VRCRRSANLQGPHRTRRFLSDACLTELGSQLGLGLLVRPRLAQWQQADTHRLLVHGDKGAPPELRFVISKRLQHRRSDSFGRHISRSHLRTEVEVMREQDMTMLSRAHANTMRSEAQGFPTLDQWTAEQPRA